MYVIITYPCKPILILLQDDAHALTPKCIRAKLRSHVHCSMHPSTMVCTDVQTHAMSMCQDLLVRTFRKWSVLILHHPWWWLSGLTRSFTMLTAGPSLVHHGTMGMRTDTLKGLIHSTNITMDWLDNKQLFMQWSPARLWGVPDVQPRSLTLHCPPHGHQLDLAAQPQYRKQTEGSLTGLRKVIILDLTGWHINVLQPQIQIMQWYKLEMNTKYDGKK